MPASQPASQPAIEPGYWRPVETINGKVLGYAWRCPQWRRVEFVRCGDGVRFEPGSYKHEVCPKCGPAGQRIRDDRECRACDGSGELPPAPDGRPVNKCPECMGSGLRKPA